MNPARYDLMQNANWLLCWEPGRSFPVWCRINREPRGCTGVCQRWLMAVSKLTWCENQSHRWPFLFLKWWWWSALCREVSPSLRRFSVSVCLMIQRQEKEWGHKITVNKTRAQNGGKLSASYRAEEKICLSDSLKTSVKPKEKKKQQPAIGTKPVVFRSLCRLALVGLEIKV